MENFDYSKLRGKIKEVFDTQKAFSDALGLSAPTLTLKLSGRSDFTQSEMNKAADLLKFSRAEIPVYFFTEKVKKF